VTSPLTAPVGGDALASRRTAAARRLEGAELPAVDEEVWRYSRVGELDPGRWRTPATVEDVPSAVDDLLASLAPLAGAVVVHDGTVVARRLEERFAAAGVFVGRASEHPDGVDSLGVVIGDGPDVFTARNDALGAEPLLVLVPRGVVVDAPIAIIDWISADDVAVHPRLVVRMATDAEATVVEWRGSADVAALSVPVCELDVDRAARLRHLVVQDRGPRVWEIATTSARVGNDGSVSVVQAGLGCEYGRSRVDCRLTGRGASGDLDAVYFATGQQTLDYRTFQWHDAPDTTSNLLFKGAVDDDARSVYTGLIRVEREARGTNAFQTNRNLKLSDRAWAESVPNLEIETNDVRCSHASTVGPIDEDQLFYLESRGVPTDTAERLIVAGFFDEVLEHMTVPAVAALVTEAIARRLGSGR